MLLRFSVVILVGCSSMFRAGITEILFFKRLNGHVTLPPKREKMHKDSGKLKQPQKKKHVNKKQHMEPPRAVGKITTPTPQARSPCQKGTIASGICTPGNVKDAVRVSTSKNAPAGHWGTESSPVTRYPSKVC